MADDVAIRVENVWKRYGLRLDQVLRQVRRGLHCTRSETNDGGPWALRDISFEVSRGKGLGIIGPNGAGKSTILKILAGVTPHTRGLVEVCGTVFPMIELNAGLNLDLTGRENVYLLGAIMGLTRREVSARMAEIEDFCELGDFFDLPVRKYSSGMLARLGFGVGAYVDADILLIDEVLAVGDIAFQNKCMAHFKERMLGQTIVYVTHNLLSLPYVCDTVLYLNAGSMVDIGPPHEIVARYEKDMFSRPVAQANSTVHLIEQPSGHVDVLSLAVTDYSGRPLDTVQNGQVFCLTLEGICHTRVESPLFGFSIVDPAGNICWWNFSAEDGYYFDSLRGRFRIIVRIPPLPLRPGRYTVKFIFRDAKGYVPLERLHAIGMLVVGGDAPRAHGIMAARAGWELWSGGEEQG
jgi:lipopolysaccharide transport system ATP-binding protein